MHPLETRYALLRMTGDAVGRPLTPQNNFPGPVDPAPSRIVVPVASRFHRDYPAARRETGAFSCVLCRSCTSSQPPAQPTQALLEAMRKLADREIKAGRMIDTGGLMPIATGAQVRVTGGELGVVDWPLHRGQGGDRRLCDLRAAQQGGGGGARGRIHAAPQGPHAGLGRHLRGPRLRGFRRPVSANRRRIDACASCTSWWPRNRCCRIPHCGRRSTRWPSARSRPAACSIPAR